MFEATAAHFVSSDQRWFCRAGDLSAAAASLIHLSRSDGYSWPSLPDVTTFVPPCCAQCAGTLSTGLVCSAVTVSVEPLKPIKDFCFLQLTPSSLTASQLTHMWAEAGLTVGDPTRCFSHCLIHPQLSCRLRQQEYEKRHLAIFILNYTSYAKDQSRITSHVTPLI